MTKEQGATPTASIGLAVATLLLVLTACGESAATNAEAADAPEPEVEPTQPVDIAPVSTTNPIRRDAPAGTPPQYVVEEPPPTPAPPAKPAVKKARKAKAVAVIAKPAPVEPPPEEGVVVETAPPEPEDGELSVGIIGGGWAEVFLDGARLDQTAPLHSYPVPIGHHTVRVANDNGLDYRQEIDVTPGGSIKITARP